MGLLTSLALALTLAISEPVYDQTDIDLMANVVMAEAGGEPFEVKQGVASVILNRLKNGKYGNSIYEVIYSPNQFSTNFVRSATDECYEAVQLAIDYPDCFPDDMLYFRNDHYFEKYSDYMHVGNTYFSTVIDYEQIFKEGIYEW